MLSYNPLRIFLPVTMLLALMATGKLVFDLVDKDLRVATNTLLLFFAAFQLLAIGLLADLMVRVTRPSSAVDPASITVRETERRGAPAQPLAAVGGGDQA